MPFKDIALGGDVNPKQPSRFQPTFAPSGTSVGPRLKRLEGFNAKYIRRGGVPILELPERAILSTYVLNSQPLAATDAGSDATINIATFRVSWPDKKDIQYRPFSIPNLAYSTTYRVYVDNPLRNGVVDAANRGALPDATRVNMITRQDTEGRIFLGNITTPAALGGDTGGTGGGGGTGSGGQGGLLY